MRIITASVLISAAVFFAVALQPAHAENWVSLNNEGWVWVELDSIHADGSLVAYKGGTGTQHNVPPNPGKWQAIDCATGRIYERDANGAWAESNWMLRAPNWPYPLLCP